MADNHKNVLIIFSSSEVGGAERSIGNMAIENSNKALEYQISTFGTFGSLTNWIESRSAECHCFHFKISCLIKFIHSNSPDVIYVMGFRLSVLLRFLL